LVHDERHQDGEGIGSDLRTYLGTHAGGGLRELRGTADVGRSHGRDEEGEQPGDRVGDGV